ncbi:MAM domain-containing protein 2-like [Pogona vitticeps]
MTVSIHALFVIHPALPTTTTPSARTTSINTAAPSPECDFSCSFDVDFCSWTQSATSSFEWTRHKGSTPSVTTGPSYDHTTGDGYYIYTEGNHGNPGDVARLLSPTCTLSGPYCFRFWYHMYGVARDMTLRVYVVPDGAAPELVWSRMGHQGDRWLSGEFSVAHKGRVQVKGGGPRGHSQGTPCPSQKLTGGAPSP